MKKKIFRERNYEFKSLNDNKPEDYPTIGKIDASRIKSGTPADSLKKESTKKKAGK